MKCASCGAEIKLGCMYCSNCGKEAQIVSESSLLEDELLRALLREEEPELPAAGKGAPKKSQARRPGRDATGSSGAKKRSGRDSDGRKRPGKSPDGQNASGTGRKRSGKRRSYVPLILIVLCLCLLIAGVTVFYVITSNKNRNSYDYQLQKALECQKERNYTKALEYFKQALSLKQEDLAVRFQMVDLYQKMEEPSTAITMLHEIISIDPKQQEAYERLIALYLEKEDYEAILKLKDSVTDTVIQELFTEFEASPPEFGLEPGTYEDAITVELFAEKGCEIYFTTNGEDPREKGEVYREPISLEEQGILEIKAVCRNEYGEYSSLLQGKFTVEYQRPRMPKASPDGGTFYGPAEVELRGIEGGRMYYTWDGSTPTVDSEEYTAPIPIPEGNNILSVILVDTHGMVSEVLKCNYKYLP